MKLYVINEVTNKVYWKDDYFGFESMDKAQMYIDSTRDLFPTRKNTMPNGDRVIWVKTLK